MARKLSDETARRNATIEITMLLVALAGLVTIAALAVTLAFSSDQGAHAGPNLGTSEQVQGVETTTHPASS